MINSILKPVIYYIVYFIPWCWKLNLDLNDIESVTSVSVVSVFLSFIHVLLWPLHSTDRRSGLLYLVRNNFFLYRALASKSIEKQGLNPETRDREREDTIV